MIQNNSLLLNIYGSYINVGTKTFRHSFGPNNFVQRNGLLGSHIGSDGFELNSGIDLIKFNNLIYKLKYGIRHIGSESLRNNPYEPYEIKTDKHFPSGVIEKSFYFNNSIDFIYRDNIIFSINFDYLNELKNKRQFSFLIGMKFSIDTI